MCENLSGNELHRLKFPSHNKISIAYTHSQLRFPNRSLSSWLRVRNISRSNVCSVTCRSMVDRCGVQIRGNKEISTEQSRTMIPGSARIVGIRGEPSPFAVRTQSCYLHLGDLPCRTSLFAHLHGNKSSNLSIGKNNNKKSRHTCNLFLRVAKVLSLPSTHYFAAAT